MIPYGRQWIDEEDIQAVVEVLRSDYLTTGPVVDAFEEALARKVGAKYGVAVSSGTAALHLLSLALLKPGDLVITTPNSFVATANSILYAGAKPLFVDIGDDGNIDLDLAIDLVRKHDVRALYVVHFSGRPVDMERLAYIRKNFGVTIVEDACHALGGRYDDGVIGDSRYSDATVFSFHPVKHITTAEGGAVVTNDEGLHHKIKRLRSHGIEREQFINMDEAYDKKGRKNPWYYEMVELGYNYRLSDIQAALGLSQLKKLDVFVQKRQAIAKRYDEAFADHPFIKPLYPFDPKSAYHLYVVRIDFNKMGMERSELFYRMKEIGIGLQVHYIPIYKQPFYQRMGYRTLPRTERYYTEVVSLPIYPGLSEQEKVIEKFLEVIG